MTSTGGPDGARETIERTAARVLLLDARERVLLLRGGDPAVPGVRYWFTLGGGLEPGESARQAAVRELHEETGLRVGPDDVLGPVWHEEVEFGFERWWVRQTQEFYVVRVETWEPVPAALSHEEVTAVDSWGWWTTAQLRAQAAGRPHDGPGEPGEVVYPPGLADLVEQAPS
jgi:8-oxo-dGTP pyrophosphatase MutT (NUDIX family)